MSAMAWWLIPLGATLVAILVASLVNRPHKFVEKYDQVEQFHRFREAMEHEAAKTRGERQKPITRGAD